MLRSEERGGDGYDGSTRLFEPGLPPSRSIVPVGLTDQITTPNPTHGDPWGDPSWRPVAPAPEEDLEAGEGDMVETSSSENCCCEPLRLYCQDSCCGNYDSGGICMCCGNIVMCIFGYGVWTAVCWMPPLIITAFLVILKYILSASNTIQLYLREEGYNVGERVLVELVLIAGGAALFVSGGACGAAFDGSLQWQHCCWQHCCWRIVVRLAQTGFFSCMVAGVVLIVCGVATMAFGLWYNTVDAFSSMDLKTIVGCTYGGALLLGVGLFWYQSSGSRGGGIVEEDE